MYRRIKECQHFGILFYFFHTPAHYFRIGNGQDLDAEICLFAVQSCIPEKKILFFYPSVVFWFINEHPAAVIEFPVSFTIWTLVLSSSTT